MAQLPLQFLRINKINIPRVFFKLKKEILIFLITIIPFSAAGLNASGYRLHELGAKAATLAGAFVGRADNTSAIFYNPAGIAFQKGLGLRINVVYFNLKYTAYIPEDDASYNSTRDQLKGSFFISYTFIDKISIGIGYFQPYIIATDWHTEWPGYNLSLNSKLNTDYFRSALAFKLNEKFSVGVGLDVVRIIARLNYNRNFSIPLFSVEKDVLAQIEASGYSASFAVGVLFRPSDYIGIGVRYQHKVNLVLGGMTKFRRASGASLPHPIYPKIRLLNLMEDFYTYEAITSSVILPAEFVMGIRISPTKKVTLHLDVDLTGWSVFRGLKFSTVISEEELQQRFYEKYGDFYGILPDWTTQGMEMKMEDAWSFKFGAEYFLKDILAIRTGYSRSQSPLPDEYLNPILPALPKNVISFGIGYDGPVRTIYDQKLMGALTFDVFVQYVIADSRTSSLPGYEYTYDSAYWVIGCGVGLNL